jgi:ATP-dependent DNA helicase RecG
MTQTSDGFVLAQRDLEQRGPGEFLGTRQSGYAELQMASLTDIHLIEKARAQAQTLYEQDRLLEKPEHKTIASELERFWGGGKGDLS